ncbi:probable polyketide synthase 1 [Bombina bombina]|uniref:probable polyketide synthase 1 n=1 Tax=Bombina bombina TaxID=8345 RepID=UPI00235AE506|nr:probable polyketide synthase 1 [Bombina bombina]
MDETDDHIAIVGLGCNFPGGEGIDNFWKVILEGKNCTVEIPAERFNTKLWFDKDYNKPGKIITSRAALIDGFNEFDNELFGIHASESISMDPQQKLLLECTYRTFENAGIPTENISGSKTGVFIGIMNRDADSIFNNYAESINHFNGTGTAASIAANRISYCFNLTGPSLVIDTACSSSLVALHYACQAIKQGDCEMAVCGGVSCIMEPRVFVALSKAKMISPEGISKPFSQNADGYGRGEGCGVVLLMPLKKAKEDFCKVWGVICASAVNQDGRSVSPITKPSQNQQEVLLQSIYSTIDPCAVQYVEAHGTGTTVGDPVEAASIGNMIGKKRSSKLMPLKIGSVKGNIGHTESAAGIAGLIKILLMMHHGVIPSSLHCTKELCISKLDKYNLSVPVHPENWEDSGKYGRMAGLNSFGFGGTNAHLVIKQHKNNYWQGVSNRQVDLFILSAFSCESLKLLIEDTKQKLNKMISLSLQNLVYTSACRRSHNNYKYRKAFLATSLTHLQQQLESANTDTAPIKERPPIIFVFCGNGVNYKGMCKMLLRYEPVFRNKCIEIDEMLQVYTPLSILDLLESEYDDFSRPDIAQTMLFTIQVSLVALLRHWGVKPDTIIGHSVGEVAAAHCAGLLSLQDAVKVIYYRSMLQAKVTGGKMLVVSNIPVTDIARVIQPYSGKICIAAYNSPTSCTLSGDAKSIDQINNQLTQTNSNSKILLHMLDVPAAYHSHLMDPILEEIKKNLQNLAVEKMETDLISTVTGKIASQGDFTTGEYWSKNIREAVAFEQALNTSKSKENAYFIEIGPRRTLQRYISEVLGQHNKVLPVIHPSTEYETIFTLLSTLFTGGYNTDWNNIYEAYKSVPADIPQYQFDHRKQEFNYEKVRQGNQNVTITAHSLLQGLNENMTEFTCSVSKATTPYIYDHKNNGSVIVPGAFYVELGLAATIINVKLKVPLNSLEISIEFSSPCVVNQQSIDLKIKLEQQNDVTNFEILASNVFATGQVRKKKVHLHEVKKISLQPILKRCKLVYTRDEIYDALSRFGFQYGSVYKQLSDIYYGRDLKEGITEMNLSEELKEEMHEYSMHPVILDCFLQMIACLAEESKGSSVIFPSAIGSLTIIRPLQEKMFIYAKHVKKTRNYLELCGCFTDVNGFILAEIINARVTFVRGQDQLKPNLFFETSWKRVLEPDSINKPDREPKILVFADLSGIGQQLKQYINSSDYIIHNNWDSADTKLKTSHMLNNGYSDVLFMWGIQEGFTYPLTQYLAKCCEVYQQVILAVREKKSKASIRTVTFRTTENTVDNINPGFVFVGMTRVCVTEMTDMSFQLIDISSSNPKTVESLAKVIQHYKSSEFPEIRIHEDNILASEIAYTTYDVEEQRKYAVPLKKTDIFTLYSKDPYKLEDLSAELTDSKILELTNKHVVVEIDQISIHTEDYFPVSLSSYQYGRTLYWNTLIKDAHKLLALDFTGTVTSVGKNVRKLKVGDHIASCYPTVALSNVTLPESVCYPIKSVPTLKNLPCISYFILAWEILGQLPKAKNNSKMVILTSEANSILCKVIEKTAKERGWELTQSTNNFTNMKQCSAVIILPPSDVISEEDLSHLPLLKDLVIISDRINLYGLQNFTDICREDVHIHILNPNSIFQKPYIKERSKYIYKWLKLMPAEMFQSIPSSVFSVSAKHMPVSTDNSYFMEKCLPLVVLDKRNISNIPLYKTQQTLFKQDAVYIVSGGLSGLGFETVKFIAHHGGGNIVTLSRTKPTPEMEQQIKIILDEQKNRRIIPLQCNVADCKAVKKTMGYIVKQFSNIPVKGVFHSAVVLHDGILPHLNQSLFEKVLSPKVEGAFNLHQATEKMDLDYFVCYSSISSFVGNPSQANYAAANSFLDIFCQYRRNQGLSGQSISWGALNLGLLFTKHNVQELLQARGILVLETQEVHEYLEKSLMINNPHQVIAKFDFKAINGTKILTLKKRFYNLVTKEMTGLNETVIPSNFKNNIKPEDYIISLVSELTSVSLNDIKMDTLLTSLGIDSMIGMTIQNRIFREKEINIPPVKLLDPSTTVLMLVLMIKENDSDTKENETTEILELTKL